MSDGARAGLRIGAEAAGLLRPAAEAFAAAVAAGARGTARLARGGAVSFASPEVEAAHQELRAALLRAVGEDGRRAVERTTGAGFDRFTDRLVRAWLRAEPGFAEFLRGDPRGSAGFVFELLRAECGEVGLDFAVESAGPARRVPAAVARGRFLLPAGGLAWIGAGTGFIVELAGVSGAAALGLLLGLGAGIAVALVAATRRPPPTCSECGATTGQGEPACARCGARFEEEEQDDGAVPAP